MKKLADGAHETSEEASEETAAGRRDSVRRSRRIQSRNQVIV